MGTFMKWATKSLARILPAVAGFVVLCHELYLAVAAFTAKAPQPLLTFAQWMLTKSQPTVSTAYAEVQTRGSRVADQVGISRGALLAIAVAVFAAWYLTQRTSTTKTKLAAASKKLGTKS